MYNKLSVLAMIAVLLLTVTTASAGEIRLNDGRYIEVEHCWEKDGEVIFKVQGNGRLFSLNKELVKEIVGAKEEPEKQAVPPNR